MLFSRFKLRYSVPAIVLFIFLVIAGIVTNTYINSEITEAKYIAEQIVRTEMNQLQNSLNYMLPREMYELSFQQISDIYINPPIKKLAVIDENNIIKFCNYSEYKMLSADSLIGFSALLADSAKTSRKKVLKNKGSYFTGYCTINLGLKPGMLREERKGILYIEYDYSSSVHQAVNKAITGSVFYAGLAFIFTIFMLWLFVRIVSSRLNRVNGSMAELAEGNSNAKAILEGNDEIAELAARFNDMASQLKEKNKNLEQMQFMVENASDAVVISDFNGKFEYVNKATCNLLEYTKDELLNMGVYSLDPEYVGKRWEEHWNELREHRSIRVETIHKTKSGVLKPVEVIANFFEFEGHEVNCAFFRDITERKIAEKQLLQQKEKYQSLAEKYKEQNIELARSSDKARESDRLKTSFLQNISHEIRTPLNGIIGFSDLIVTEQLNSEDYLRFGKLISESGRKLLALVNDILDISKIEAGQIRVNKSNFNIAPDIEELAKLHALSLKNKDVELSVENNLGNELTLYTDRSRFFQIVNNLLSNACKFTSSGSIILGASIDHSRKLLEVWVKDTGRGISPEHLERIFDRFFQIERSGNEYTDGTGLGLAISKRLAKLLDGDLIVQSQPNIGSKFTLLLPLTNSSSPPAMLEAQPSFIDQNTDVGNCSILIAEDDDINYMYLAEVLKMCSLTRAQNGAIAIDLAMKSKYDLILMDLKMPVIDGLTAVRKIRETQPNIPIIAQTAYAMDSDRKKALTAGCNDFISKPVKQKCLLQKVALHTKRKEFLN